MENTDFESIDIPLGFRHACELFGIKVSDFLQLYVNHFSYIDHYFHDNSVYDLVTKSFDYVHREQGAEKLALSFGLDEKALTRGGKLIQRQIKLSMNRNYSYSQRRNKGRLLTHELFELFSKADHVKDFIYLDIDTKILLNKDVLFKSLLSGISVTQFLNRIMQCVTLPDHLARMHLDEGVYNPVLAVYMRVYDGYGNICDQAYQKSPKCRLLIMEIQELDKRYFFCRDLQQRVAFYQDWLDEYLERDTSIY